MSRISIEKDQLSNENPSRLNASLLRLKLLDSLRNNDQKKLSAYFQEANTKTNLLDPLIANVLRLILHYAVQVGPLSIVQYIVSQGYVEDINIQDNEGNTPLHLATASSRYEIVNFLMNLPGINDCILNNGAVQAIELTDDLAIIQLMSDLRTKFVEIHSNELRKLFEKRNFDKLLDLLSNQRIIELLDINGVDPITGDGVLHEFVKKDDTQMCKFILEHGGDPFKRNVLGKLPVDLAVSSSMKKMLKESSKEQSIIDPMGNGSSLADQAPTYKGFLKKWTNFAGGYKLRWFVLDADGRLSYYKSPNDINKNCRGAINLTNARLKMDSSEKSKFEIEIPSTTGASIKWHLKSNHYIELNRWVWFLQNAIRYAKDLHRQQMMNSNSVSKQQRQNLRNRESFDSTRTSNTFTLNQPVRTHQRQASTVSLTSASDSDYDSEIIKKHSKVKKLKSKLTPGSSTNKKILEEIDENNRLRVKAQSASSSIISPSKANSIKSSSPSSRSTPIFTNGMDPMGDESDDDFEDSQTVDQETGDVIEKKSGPHGSQIIVLQNNLKIEVQSLKDFLLDTTHASPEDVKNVCTNTLSLIEVLLDDLKVVLNLRDQKLQSKINRQKEVSTLWENSIKTLEFEMKEREQKIVALEDKQSHLKKVLKQKINTQNVSSSPTADEVDNSKTSLVGDSEIAEFLNDNEDESEDEFFDAEGMSEEDTISETTTAVSDTQDDKQKLETAKEPQEIVLNQVQQEKLKLIKDVDESFKGYEDPIRKRLKMSVDDRPKISLWSTLKAMVGKDMTKMTLPVSFNEPTSLLQRVAEDMEYTALLDKAAQTSDSTLRMVYVAAFAASEYASTINRIAKPFNPLLGETFEYSRPDKSYRFLVEQVSHHPPIGAAMAESQYWDYYGESSVKSKFYGRSFDIKPLGTWFLNLRPSDGSMKNGTKVDSELYSWKKVTSSVVGIIVGNPTVDNYGEMNIQNHSTGDSINLVFKARGWRESSAYEVKGTVLNAKRQPVWQINGHWNSKIFARRIDSKSESKVDKNDFFLVWQANTRPKIPFNLTEFATSLNAPQKSLVEWLPRTDTRFRPDQRAMEEGRYDDAAKDKNRVEEKQRAALRRREAKNKTYAPKWFSKLKHPVTGEEYWKFHGDYWKNRLEKQLLDVPDIF